MGNRQDAGLLELQAQSLMLKALYVQRMAFKYQINVYVIKSNYKKIHVNRKHESDTLKLTKVTFKKLEELEHIFGKLSASARPKYIKSKFINKINSMNHNTHSFIQIEDPESLISYETESINSLRLHQSKLEDYMQQLLQVQSKNSKKIEENQKKDIMISKVQNEIADMKHYNSFLNVTHEYLGKKRCVRARERRATWSNQSTHSIKALYLLRESKKQVRVYQDKIKDLNSRIDKKMLAHDKRYSEMRYSVDLFSHEKELERQLDELLSVEDRLSQSIKRLQKTKTHSSVSTYEDFSRDLNPCDSDKKVIKFTEFLHSLHRKRYHVSELPDMDLDP